MINFLFCIIYLLSFLKLAMSRQFAFDSITNFKKKKNLLNDFFANYMLHFAGVIFSNLRA